MSAHVLTFAKAATLAAGQWVQLRTNDGREDVVRFVHWVVMRKGGERWAYVDHGRYGTYRDDCWIRASTIERIENASRPPVFCGVVDPLGRKHFVGRFRSEAEALACPAVTTLPPGGSVFFR